MDYFGINSSEDLPKISEVLMEELVHSTNVKEAEENMEAENAAEAESVIIVEETIEEEIIATEAGIEDTTEEILAVTESGEIVEEANDADADENREA